MNSIAVRVGASALCVLLAGYPQMGWSQGFTGAEFMAWSEASQNGFLQSSVTMATFIAAQNNGDAATCLETWYAPGLPEQALRNEDLRDAIAQYSDYHPSGVILAVLQEACGPIGG